MIIKTVEKKHLLTKYKADKIIGEEEKMEVSFILGISVL